MKKCYFFVLLLFNFCSFSQNLTKIDSLKKVIINTKIDTSKVWALIALGNEIEGTKPDEAYKYYKQAEAISRKTKYARGVVKAISNFTYILDLKNKLNESKPYYEEAVMMAKKHQLGSLMEAQTNANLGTWYYRNMELVKAVESYSTAWKLAEISKNEDFALQLKANTATIYNALKRYDESIKTCNEVIVKLKNKQEFVYTLIQCLHTKATAFSELEKYKESIPIFEEALALAEKNNIKNEFTSILINLAVSYRRVGKDEKSLKLSQRCLVLSKEIEDIEGIRSAYHNIGQYYFFKDNMDSASKYYEFALKMSIENNISAELHEAYNTMANVYLRKGNMKKYEELAKKADSIEVQMQGKLVQNTAKELEVKYETEKKQNEILQKNIELQKSNSKNQLLGFGLVSMVLLAGLGFYSFRKKQQTKILESTLESQKFERQRIASEMHDELGGNLTSLMYLAHSLKLKNTENIDNQQVDKIIKTSSEISESINEIVWALNQSQNSLADWVFYTKGKIVELLENSDLEYSINIPNVIPDRTLSNVEKRNLYLVVKEAVNNSIRHAQAKTIEVKMDFAKQIIVEISDDGIGFAEKNDQKAGTGNGLKNMRYRMTEIGGKIDWQNFKGTKVSISIT